MGSGSRSAAFPQVLQLFFYTFRIAPIRMHRRALGKLRSQGRSGRTKRQDNSIGHARLSLSNAEGAIRPAGRSNPKPERVLHGWTSPRVRENHSRSLTLDFVIGVPFSDRNTLPCTYDTNFSGGARCRTPGRPALLPWSHPFLPSSLSIARHNGRSRIHPPDDTGLSPLIPR